LASITLEEVGKRFPDGTEAVSDVSLRIEEGEFLVLVGPSGSGKTTVLRIVAGLEDATAGRVLIGDRLVNDVEPRGRDLAMVFQSYALYPHMSVEENMGFALRMQHVSKPEIRERTRAAAELLGITELLAKRPRQLSGGQRQRVALGRAVVRQPQAFLMDEPLSNLDAKLRVQMRADIAKLQRDLETTTIYVTHDQVEAMTMGDRVAVMNQGRLQQVDTPQRLYDNPANLFVAGFIGTPPMNLLAATVASQNGSVNVMLGRQQVPLSDEAMRRFPGVRGREGSEVVLGVRADNLHRADRRPDLPAINADLELIEALGSQSIAYFRVDAMVIGVDDDLLEEQELDGEGVTAARPNLVAAMPAEEAIGLRAGEQVPVAIDTKHIHLFDAETGAPLR
jgi:multiple sugar transport system ATP-binding protein